MMLRRRPFRRPMGPFRAPVRLRLIPNLLPLLIIWILRGKEIKGSELEEEVKKRIERTPINVLYMTLRELEVRGFISSQGSGAPRERIYKITDRGRKLLEKRLEEMKTAKKVLDEILSGFQS